MNDYKQLFTVITVTYNDLPGLQLTADSVAEQTCKDYEWLVVDGASTDGTVGYLEQQKAGCNFTWVSEKDSGIYDAMNKGIAMARGEFIVFLNAGDVFPTKETLRTVKDYLSSLHQAPDVLFGGATLRLPNGRQFYRPPRQMEEYIWHGVPANHQATYFSGSSLRTTRYDTKYKICGDYYLVATLYLKGCRAAYIDQPLVDFRVGDTSYRNPARLFAEPYMIQRDVLRQPFWSRLRSLAKRFVSTLGIFLFSQMRHARPK